MASLSWAILFIALLSFFAFKHFGRETGDDRMLAMLFDTSPGK